MSSAQRDGSTADDAAAHASGARPSGRLYLVVLAAVLAGAALGVVAPARAIALKPLGDLFVRALKMLIAPIVFTTVATGIASAGDMKKVGRVGLKAILYFEAMTTLALGLGLGVVHVLRPGDGIHAQAANLDAAAVAAQTRGREAKTLVAHLADVIPESVASAFVSGDVLQVLFLAVLTGLALVRLGERGRSAVALLEHVAKVFFELVGMLMRAAPLGAFGAMAYTVGHFGVGALAHLGRLMLGFYATSLLFVFVVLGAVTALAGLSLWRLLRYLREELLLVLGTSSSESALPQLMTKLEHLGCDASVVRLVVPTGYSFNLDGTSIYLTMAAVFVAQALDVPLSLGDELALLAVLLLTSKGAAAVTGGGFVTLAATLQTTQAIPVAGLSLLLGVDRFMSEARALTNLVGNSVATIVVARWEGALDVEKARSVLKGDPSRKFAPSGET